MNDRSVNPNTLWGLMGLNVAVYALWHTWGLEHVEFMRDNFMLSWEGIQAGRVWTLITSEFSHVDAMHLLSNLLGLFVFGQPVHEVLGSKRFVGLYLAGALAASVGYTAWGALTGGTGWALGASGAVSAMAVPYAMWFPKRTLLLMFFIPMPAWVAVLAFLGLDFLGLFSGGVDAMLFGPDIRIAHSAHLGGAVLGLVVALPLWLRIRSGPPQAE